MQAKKPVTSKSQISFDFENSTPPDIIWPENIDFPLNLKNHLYRRTVLQEVKNDLDASQNYLVVTGFISLAHIIEFFGKQVDFNKTKHIRIVLGFEPDIKHRKTWKTAELDKEIKDYWANQNYSLLNGGEVIQVIEYIKQGKISFKLSDGLHAKIYVGDHHCILGSANFSKNGMTIQQEANIRIRNNPKIKHEKKQFDNISLVANNFYDAARNYDSQIISLLQELLKVTTWQEALARAIAELLERSWQKDLPELYEKLNGINLWPSQRLGLGQALYILQTQGCVLIADPTGSGKTKLISTLQLVLFHWLWETGRRNKSYALTICPPLVKDSWTKEFIDMQFSQNGQISMGALSLKNGNNYTNHLKEIKNANILVIDEAHNFLNLNSQRSSSIAEHTSDNVILSTATPINRKPNDLVRLIELLGVDNLRDDELIQFKELKKQKNLKGNSSGMSILRNFIRRFIVRRTKTQLNNLIDQSPDLYVNREGNRCRYPVNECETYRTGETKRDKELARKINKVASELKGLIFLQDISKPDYEYDYDEPTFLEKRLVAAKALTIYNIQAKIRSSKAALLEHIEGTEAAMEFYKFKSSKNKSGNIIKTLQSNKNKLPKNDFSQFSPIWLTDLNIYHETCEKEILAYQSIANLSKEMSRSREEQKVNTIIKFFKEHNLVLAFDSTVLTLDYLSSIITEKNFSENIECNVVTGTTSKSSVTAILKKFDLGSKSKDVLALCSDSMSEGVNLQQASALVFLDMPSVLRIAEQRIGRIDRLDSPHKKIKVYWPDDSEEFSLRTDFKLIRTSIDTESLIGSNFNIPIEILDKHLNEIVKAEDMIKALQEEKDQDYLWEGMQDAFQSIHDLYEGKHAIIKSSDYQYYKNVDASVKVKLSIGLSSSPWLFLAVRGSKTMSPRWYFIDSDSHIHLDFPSICNQLRNYLKTTEKWEEKWLDPMGSELNRYKILLKQNEINILPTKRKRVLEIAQYILNKKLKHESPDVIRRNLILEVLEIFELKVGDMDYNIDYYAFSQHWLDKFTPLLQEKRLKQKRGAKTVITLNDLRVDYKTIDLSSVFLEDLKKKITIIPNIWNQIAACIIGVSSS